ncbi:MAG TPA: PfkB family carbohydrate kinase [Solirubrobacterales bacterium]|nr:PfkB family carbohydrate kinase [Solirubrobacterales bacterium]
MNGRLLVVGDTLLDRGKGDGAGGCRPGGAGLAAALAARNGRPVTLLTALPSGHAGGKLARLLLNAGVDLIDLGLASDGTPESVSGAGAEMILRSALSEANGVLVSDCGQGIASDPQVRTALTTRPRRVPLVWDPDPHGATPLSGTTLVTPNLVEALACSDEVAPGGESDLAELATGLARRWRADQVVLTLGEDGAMLAPGARGPWHVLCAKAPGETRGAGAMFAAEVTSRLADGRNGKDAVISAVAAATRYVSDGYTREDRLRLLGRRSQAASLSAPSPSPTLARALKMAGRVRKRGGTIIATDASFDVLRREHVRCFEAAARLGDRLVVLLDSEHSAGAAALHRLPCVDEVAIFDGASPLETLRLLRPEVWARSRNAIEALPESHEVSSWGGRLALLPHAFQVGEDEAGATVDPDSTATALD